MSFLRIIFPPPGFFIADTRLGLTVNAHPVVETSFVGGLDWWSEMAPGLHVVETSIQAPLGFARKRTYQLEVRPELVTIAVLDYSRMWGNMTDAPKSVSFVPR